MVLSGGGVNLPGIVQLAKEKLRLPVRIAKPVHFEGISEIVDDPASSVAMGAVLWGIENEVGGYGSRSSSSGGDDSFKKMVDWFKNFLP